MPWFRPDLGRAAVVVFERFSGASLCFLLSKDFRKAIREQDRGNSTRKGRGILSEIRSACDVLVRMLPFVPFDAISYGAPLVGVPFSRVPFATALGIIPSPSSV
jgi:uncharacterized membrane protein YdjX (TVP38/TMEM64 family)